MKAILGGVGLFCGFCGVLDGFESRKLQCEGDIRGFGLIVGDGWNVRGMEGQTDGGTEGRTDK